MNKIEAVAAIKGITGGSGVDMDRYPAEMRGRLAVEKWNSPSFSFGAEYGYVLALMDAFDIVKKDLHQTEVENMNTTVLSAASLQRLRRYLENEIEYDEAYDPQEMELEDDIQSKLILDREHNLLCLNQLMDLVHAAYQEAK